MPPRKTKVQYIEESPVIFFLRISEDETIIPAEETISYCEISTPVETTYSEILDSVESSKTFSTELLKTILDKEHIQYPPQTACFWCCHSFKWSQVVLPVSYDAYKNIYTCEGNFCSPECALAYNYADMISDSMKWNRHALLSHLYATLYTTRQLSVAPSRNLLRMFGGPLDIKQYREYIMTDNDIVLSAISPVRLVFPTMNVQGPLRDIKKYVSLSEDVVEKASEQLRLKRSKPLTTNIQTLDKCIKVFT